MDPSVDASTETSAGRAFWERQRRLLSGRFLARDEAIDAMQLAVLAGEHAFLLGPPGTGKSALVRAFFRTLEGRYFEHSLSRTRVDSAVLGPLDIPLLRDHGQFRRTTDGYLPSCEWAFLDEISHISPELGHDLHALLNERVHHEVAGARSVHRVPLRTAITAANTVPLENRSADGDDARALWDRLLVRVPVSYLSEREDVRRLLRLPGPDPASDAPDRTTPGRPGPDRLAREQLDEHTESTRRVDIPDAVIDACIGLRETLAERGEVFSDRRWRASMRLVQCRAWLRGRRSAHADDLDVLRFTLWDTPEQRDRVTRDIVGLSDPVEASRLELLDMARLLARSFEDYRGRSAAVREAWGREAARKLGYLRQRSAALRSAWGRRGAAPLDELDRELATLARALDRGARVDAGGTA